MDKLSRVARMLQPTLMGLALLLGGMAFYHYHYVPAREEVQTSRLFRHLIEISEQVAQKYNNLTTCLQNAAAAMLESAGSGNQGKQDRDWSPLVEGVESFVPNLTILGHDLQDKTNEGFVRTVSAEIRRSNANSPLTCRVTWETNRLALSARVSVDFAALMAAILSRHEFQDVLLVSTNGRVLSQPGNGLPPLERLPKLSRMAGPGLPEATTNLVDLAEIVAPTRAAIEIYGRRFLVFLVPVALPFVEGGQAGPSGRWLLAGLVEERDLIERARPLPYFVVFGFVAAVVLLAILLPFLNLVTSGGRHPIHSQHLVFLVTATLTGTCGLVVVAAHIAQHRHQEAQLDLSLDRFALTIDRNFRREVRDAVTWLSGFDTNTLPGSPLESAVRVPNLSAHAYWSSPAGRAHPAPIPSELKVVHWDQDNGFQAVKWSTTNKVTPRVNVGDRPYFSELNTGRNFPIDLSAAEFGVKQRFFLQPIYSRLRSEYVLACSIPAPVRALGGFTNLAVVCAEFQPASLMKTLLPPGYLFAVVDSAGRVLFHGDARRNQQEDLLVECDSNPRLAAALAGRGVDTFSGDYYQRPHDFHVRPMIGLPWMVVVMREHRILDSIRASQAAATITVLAAAGFLVVLVLWSAAALRRQQTRRTPGIPRWLWPNEGCLNAYRSSSLAGAALIVAAVALEFTQFRLSAHPAVVLALVGSGPALVLVSCLRFARQTRLDPRGRRTLSSRAHQREYVRCLAISLAVLVIPAALAMHRVLGELESERFVRWTQSALGDSAWARILESKAPPESVSHSGPGDYQSVFLDTRMEWQGPREAEGLPWIKSGTVFDQILHALRRDFSSGDNLGTRMHGWGSFAAGDTNWWTARPPGFQELVERHWHPTASAGTLKISSRALTFPGWGGQDGWVLISLAGVVLGLLAAWLSARFIATRMLLLRFMSPGSVPLPSLVTAVADTASDTTPASETIRVFAASERHRVLWVGGKDPGPPEIPPGSTLVWDRREERGAASPELSARWIHAAEDLDCQVVVLVSSAADADAVRPTAAIHAGIWSLPAHVDATGSVLIGLGREYEGRWNRSTPGEQRVLWEVARTGFEDGANRSLPGLLQTGWLRLDPKLGVSGGAWRRFLRVSTLVPASSADANTTEWSGLRTLLVVGALAIMAFLMITQPDTWQRTTGVVAGLLAGFKLMGDFLGTIRKEAADTGSDR
ncbi:MAG: cache domain-containing protein [Verrucomicrobiales bacterium]|nr:cache domain-containing protein [Verrucomicrobiales bacterium]